MILWGAGPIRRLLAALLLVASGLPVALELATHDGDVVAFGRAHLEAASVRHHGDDCLASQSPSPLSSSVGAISHVYILATSRAAVVSPATGIVGQEPRHTTRSRAPPGSVA